MPKESMVTIFGKSYPMYKNPNGTVDENSVRFVDWLPDFFASKKHFSPKEYYDAIVAKFPQFKRKWYNISSLPSEKDIEKYFLDAFGYGAMDGANSVPPVERKYGIKIGGGYKYPDNMTDIEYHAHRFNKIGFYNIMDKEVESVQDAYMNIWQAMHYEERDLMPVLQSWVQELISLNPQLKTLQFDKNNRMQLIYILAGATYDFPAADIQLFLDGVRGRNVREQQKAQLAALGLDPKDFQWILSPATIRDIATKIKTRDMSGVRAEAVTCEDDISAHKIDKYAKATERVKNNAEKKVLLLERLKSIFKE